MDLGSAIKLCRISHNMKQAQLGEIADCDVASISLIECNKRDPSLSMLISISKALEMPLSLLIFLASDETDLAEIDKDTIEKLSFSALRLIKRGSDHGP